jgi:hypothetical protein
MKTDERRTVALGGEADDVAVIYDGTGKNPLPRLTIFTEPWMNANGAVVPSGNVLLVGPQMRRLYEILREFYGDAGKGKRKGKAGSKVQ